MKYKVKLLTVNKARRLLLILMILTVAIGFSACYPYPKPIKPQITGFGVEPTTVCTNLGVPMVRVAWTVNSPGNPYTGDHFCMRIDVNGNQVSSGSINNRCSDEGEALWDGETTVNLRDIFGGNIPSTVIVNGTIDEIGIGDRDLASASASVTTRVDCTAGFTTQ
jgi:hypothetical protein